MFVGSGTDVYKGQIVGIHQRPGDLSLNVCKKKAATNVRSNKEVSGDNYFNSHFFILFPIFKAKLNPFDQPIGFLCHELRHLLVLFFLIPLKYEIFQRFDENGELLMERDFLFTNIQIQKNVNAMDICI